SCVHAILETLEKLFYEFHPSGRCQQINGTALVQARRWLFHPAFRFGLRSEHGRRFGKNFGELPCTSALFLVQWFRRRVLATLKRPQTHSYCLFERVRLADDRKVSD